MVKIPLPQDGDGVPYLANPDGSGNLAVPNQSLVLLPNNQYLEEGASLRQQQVITTTPLGANAPYTQTPAIDSLAVPQDNMVCAHVFADQAGTLFMDVSMDNTNWNLVQATVVVTANVASTIPWQAPLDRYYRFRYVNGSTTQTVFRLSTSAMSVAGPQNVNASIVGSLANALTVIQNAVQTTANGASYDVSGQASAIFTLSGTFVGTITFEYSMDGGTTWFPLSATGIGMGTVDSTATALGGYRATVVGLKLVRARVSSYTSGAITVNITTSANDDVSKVVKIAGSQYQDLGQVITGGAIAAGATVYSSWHDNLSWVRNVVALASVDSGLAYSVQAQRRGSDLVGSGYDLAIGTSSGLGGATGIPVLVAGSNALLGYSVRFGIKNTSASPTTVANLKVQLMGQ